jgi:large subunit ribosomal protein L10
MKKEEKIKMVEELSKLMGSYPTIGFIDMRKMPTRQYQDIKKGLGDGVIIKITKKTVIRFAMRKMCGENVGELEKSIPLQPGLVVTKLSPFQFYRNAQKLKSSTYAKEGDVAENDIEIKKGPTDLLPGPVISEFAKVKIPAGVEGGKIAVKKDIVVAKKGDVISGDLANILRKVKIKAAEVKLNIVILYENGEIFTKDTLKMVEEYPGELKKAFGQALNLSIAIGFPTKENIKYLLAKAYHEAEVLEKIGGAS